MHSDAALDPDLRARIFPNSRFEGPANVLVFANTDAASGVRNIIKVVAGGLEVGPILMGMGNKAHIVTPVDHRARAAQHRRARGGAGAKLRLSGRHKGGHDDATAKSTTAGRPIPRASG